MAEQLSYDLIVGKNDLLKSLDEAIRKSETLEGALGTAVGVLASTAAIKTIDLVANGIGNTIQYVKDAAKAYSQEEEAINKVSQALRSVNQFSNTAVEDLVNFSDALSRASRQGGELILSQLAVAKSMGATNTQAKELVQAAANLSATYGGSLEQNVQLLGKTLDGTTGKLSLQVRELKSLTKEQLIAGDAIRIVNERFGGAAASELNSYAGRLHQLDSAFDDITKNIGRFVAENSVTKYAIDAATSSFRFMADAIKGATDSLGIGITPIQEQRNKLKELAVEYNQLGDVIKSAKRNFEFSRNAGGEELANSERLDAIIRKIAQAEERRNQILKERVAIRQGISADQEAAKSNAGVERPIDQKILDDRSKLNESILNLDKQLALEQENAKAEAANRDIENEQLRGEAELQRMIEFDAQKAELEFQLKEAEIARIDDGEQRRLAAIELARQKELALTKQANAALVKEDDLKRKNKEAAQKKELAMAETVANAEKDIALQVANLGASIAKDGSTTQFVIQKAAAIAQTIVATQLAMAKALAIDPTGVLSSRVAIAGGINLATIVATSLKGLYTGGIVGGDNQGASMGPDDTIIKARNGEMMLNAEQQSTLFEAIKNGNLGGNGEVTINVDGVALFKAMRRVKQQGYAW